MGLCGSIEVDPDQSSVDRHIDQELIKQHRKTMAEVRILLLGAGECGKSTILKQMKILHRNGFTKEERQYATELARSNTLEAMQALVQAALEMDFPFSSPANRLLAEAILAQPLPELFDPQVLLDSEGSRNILNMHQRRTRSFRYNRSLSNAARGLSAPPVGHAIGGSLVANRSSASTSVSFASRRGAGGPGGGAGGGRGGPLSSLGTMVELKEGHADGGVNEDDDTSEAERASLRITGTDSVQIGLFIPPASTATAASDTSSSSPRPSANGIHIISTPNPLLPPSAATTTTTTTTTATATVAIVAIMSTSTSTSTSESHDNAQQGEGKSTSSLSPSITATTNTESVAQSSSSSSSSTSTSTSSSSQSPLSSPAPTTSTPAQVFSVVSTSHGRTSPLTTSPLVSSAAAASDPPSTIHSVSKSRVPPFASPSEIADAISVLWEDKGIKMALKVRSQFHLLDSCEYLVSRAKQIFSDLYVPSDQDILRLRVPTVGIVETTFVVNNLRFRMFDVGGQRGERKKWIHCFGDATAVMFVTSLAEYDQHLVEDPCRNRMVESLALFEMILKLPWFQSTPIILFLNKNDLFQEKVAKVDLGQYFAEYRGGHSYQAALHFIRDLFFNRNEDPNRQIYAHVTDATDTSHVEFVFNTARDIIADKNLRSVGLK